MQSWNKLLRNLSLKKKKKNLIYNLLLLINLIKIKVKNMKNLNNKSLDLNDFTIKWELLLSDIIDWIKKKCIGVNKQNL